MSQIQASRSLRIHKQVSEHYKTPRRFRIKEIFEFFEKKGITLNKLVKLNIFRTMGVKVSSEYVILAGSDRTRHNDSNTSDLRGLQQKMIDVEVAEVDKILEEITIDDDVLSWKALNNEIDTRAKWVLVFII